MREINENRLKSRDEKDQKVKYFIVEIEMSADGPTISALEKQFRLITDLLYTTSVPAAVLEQKVLPFIADDVIFKDPWQEGGNKQLYRIGMKGKKRKEQNETRRANTCL